MSMKMTAEERQSIETAASWQSHQQYDRSTVLMLLNHIKALEWEIESVLKAGEDIVNSRLGALDEALSEIGKHARTILNLNREKKRLEEEVDAAREGRKVAVPREVADALEELKYRDNRKVLGWAAFNILTVCESNLVEPACVIKKHFEEDPFGLMEFFVNGYTVEQTPDDYVVQEYRTFLKKGQDDAVAAVEMVLGIFKKDDLLHRLRNEVH